MRQRDNHTLCGTRHQLLTAVHPETVGTPLKAACDHIQKTIQSSSTLLSSRSERIKQGISGLGTKRLQRVHESCNPGCFKERLVKYGLQVFAIALGWDLLELSQHREAGTCLTCSTLHFVQHSYKAPISSCLF